MYEIPSHPEVVKCVVNAECITRGAPPLLLLPERAGRPVGRPEPREVGLNRARQRFNRHSENLAQPFLGRLVGGLFAIEEHGHMAELTHLDDRDRRTW